MFQIKCLLMSPKPKDARRKPSRVSTDGKFPAPPKKKKSKKAVKAIKTTKSDQEQKPSKDNLDQLGELPRSHGADRIFLIARDPHRLYCYWDIDISRHPGGPTYLRAFVGSEESPESELPVTFETRNHELPARQAGSRYTVELGYHRGKQWHCLARSATVETPPDHMADAPGTTFTTIPWPAKGSSSRGSQPSDQPVPPPLTDLPPQHRRILEVLLGKNLLRELSSASFSSDLSSWGGHSERLSSPGPLDDEALQLRADVFLEGRTRPGTYLTIDGRPVPVHPDGSFRHHFTFGDPDGSHAVSLVAAASDEMESRRITLRLDRKTDLVHDATARPEAS